MATITLSSFISFTEKLPKRTNASNAIKFVNNNWLDKYKNDKDFINCYFFNAYKNGNLIKKVLIKQFLYQTKLAFAEFQQHILKTYSNLQFCWINEENDLSSSTKVIEFNQEYFALLNKKIDWETFFNCDTCNFNVTTNCLEKEIVSCFLCDNIKGIYYIDEKNKSNDIGQSLKKENKWIKSKKWIMLRSNFMLLILALLNPFLRIMKN